MRTACHKCAICLTGVFLLNGCQLVPDPDPHSSVASVSKTSAYVYYAPEEADEAIKQSEWWKGIGGSELAGQVNQLLENNFELAEARQRVNQAWENANQRRADRLPAVTSSFDASRSRSANPLGEFSWNDRLSTGLAASFDLDVFGNARSSHRAAWLNAKAAELNYQATEQAFIAALAKSWVAAAITQDRLDLALETAESYQTTYKLTSERHRAGSAGTSASDVLIAEQNLDAALADIPRLETQLVTQLMIIDQQLGELPGTTAQSFKGDIRIEPVFTAPIGMSAPQLLSRPDVASAELSYLAALQDIGAARASLLPGLSLTASLSFQDEELADLFDWDRYIASIAGSLTQPVFQGGRLRSRLRLEESQAEELATAYARFALGALNEVETALAQQSGFLREWERLRKALRSAESSHEIALNRYRQGLLPLLSVLETQRGLTNALQSILSVQQSLLESRIDLHLSLGGTWFAPNENSPATTGKK